MSVTIEELEALMLGFPPGTTKKDYAAAAQKLKTDLKKFREDVEEVKKTLPEPAPKPAIGNCGICGEDEMLVPCTLVAGKPCRHMFCQPCLSQWIEHRVKSRVREIICPATNCSHQINQMDIVRLSEDPSVPEAHTALMAEKYTDRLQEMLADPELKEWIDENARACPKCSLLITRENNSCNSIACQCGHRYCYCCGEVKCVNSPIGPTASFNAFHKLLKQQEEIWNMHSIETETKMTPLIALQMFKATTGGPQ